MSLRNPERFPRRTLLLVGEAHPEIIRATIVYLTQKSEPRFIPTDIQVITTQVGAAMLRRAFLDPVIRGFDRLLAEYSLPRVAFGLENIRVVPDEDGKQIDQKHTMDHKASAAQFWLDVVRHLTEDESRAIHACICGGGRIGGYPLQYSLSLFGRPQDRLMYALSAPERESLVSPPNGQTSDEHADIQFADIPFVRLHVKSPVRQEP